MWNNVLGINRTNRICLLHFFVLFVCFSCNKDEAPQAILPSVQALTLDAVGIHEAFVASKLTRLASAEITDYGFVYAKESISTLKQGTKVSLGPTTELKEFSGRLSGLEKQQKYFVRAYASTADTTVYSSQTTLTTHNTNEWFVTSAYGWGTQFYNSWQYGLVANGKGYVGFGSPSDSPGAIGIPLFEYDPLINTFTRLPDCPAPYYRHSKRFSLNEKLYVLLPNSNYLFKHLWRFDAAKKEWKQLSDLPEGLGFSIVHSFILYGQAYLVGNNDSNNRLDEIWQYNEAEDKWSKFSTLPYYSGTGTISSTVHGVMQINNKIYIIVALVTDDPMVLEFDPISNKYTTLKIPPFYLPQGSVNNFALTSTAYGLFFTSGIWKYNPESDVWTPIINSPSGLVNPLILNDVLYIIGDSFHWYGIE